MRKSFIAFLSTTEKKIVGTRQLVVEPSSERNKQPILDVLQKYIPTDKKLHALEIPSGTGQHVVHFANYYENIDWQPCEYDQPSLRIIQDHIAHSQLTNIQPPKIVDAGRPVSQWADGTLKLQSYDVVFSANLMHISPWKASLGLLKGASQLLKPSGYLFVFGPFSVDGIVEAESNMRFNMSLKKRNPEWGIRDRRDVEKVAQELGFQFQTCIDMPANNKTLIFTKLD